MIRTIILMVALMLIFMFVGNAIAGEQGMMIAFLMACGMNFFSYFFSDKMVLRQYKATEVTPQSAPELYSIVSRLSKTAGLPMPKVYIIPDSVPNAFATGRNPEHAAVAATQGLLKILSEQEIEGVLAHEMSHVRHYDILIGSVAAVFAGAIAMLANVARFNAVAGDETASNRRQSGIGGMIAVVLMPIAATIIQMSISRTREYKADEGAAHLTHHPEWLMSALAKLEDYAQNYRMQRATSQTAHMFIINPFSGIGSLSGLFSTHPSTKDRLARLEQLKKEM
ncbi:MAG: zinc metalloprotease HtpX [Alphaproteobacteria bacterium]|nr:zinc metalloprotease HtpX [Alphaproteobacteria bacterium]